VNAAAPSAQPKDARVLRRALRACAHGDPDKAERLCHELLQEQPDNFDVLHCLGQINYRRGRLDAALALLQAALKSDLGRAEGFASLGLVFHALAQRERALISYEEGLRIEPDNAELLNRRGVALLELGRMHEALENFERALAVEASHFEALGNFGNAMLKLNRPQQALAAYDRALKIAPENAQLLTNRAVALRRLDRPHEAAMSAARALRARPDFAEARFVESVARLTLGDFSSGWRGYEARWAIQSLAPARRKFAAPQWRGREPLDGKSILLHAEQGFGDTIQFVRYAPLVAARGGKVILEVQPTLARLCARVAGVASVVARGDELPHFDFHCPLLSLPLAFATGMTTIPADIPYLSADSKEIAAWQPPLPQQRPRVGLVWSGARGHDNDLNRSMPLAALTPLFELADIAFVSLQHDVREEDAAVLRSRPDVLQVGPALRDFAETAAAIASLDLVIAVDTAVAHLTGAIGKPLFLLLPYAADFRWLRERADSPWYPTARLFRQAAFGEWDSVVAVLRAELTRSLTGAVPFGAAVDDGTQCRPSQMLHRTG